jgi:hypothetical protein
LIDLRGDGDTQFAIAPFRQLKPIKDGLDLEK